MRAFALAPVLASTLMGCRWGSPPSEPPDQPASPQAKAEPAPIASLPLAAGSANAPALNAALDGGVVPQPLRTDRSIAGDTSFTKETTKDGSVVGYTLEVVFRPSDVPAPAKGAEPAALDAARRKTEPRWTVDLSPSHARIAFGSGFVLREGTELRGRVDRLGHVVYSPDEGVYRVAAPGALRALIGERRLDVAPESTAELTHNGEGPRRFSRPTHKVEVSTRAAKTFFELGHITELGEGSTLVCRSLLELVGAPPTTPMCAEGDVPLHAEIHWTNPPVALALAGGAPAPVGATGKGRVAGTLTYDVVGVTRRADLTPSSLAVPPAQASFLDAPFPPDGARLLLTRSDLAAFRAGAPESRLSLANSSDELRFVWLEGVPVAWVAPGARLDVPGLVVGRYGLEWRTFLGDAIEPAQTLALPATSDLGSAEAPPP